MRDYKEYTILNAQAAQGIGSSINVKDFRHVVVMFGTASSANLTVKFQGSILADAPDFSAAQSVSNHWDFVQVKDLQSAASIDGDTGISPAGTDDFRILEINTNGLNWINARVTAYAAGNVTIKVVGYND